ncbi:hypothetical protein CLV54_1902 [Compostimonas suwonensis]|uniref:Uncharacterized protein n=2 Tax=Compostimonas suwonensis TaxID=1048394 RepID=A0A2M9BW06_9MICO|nr:hypothetical protein CLV54_1902 [Compostimonas suwonensis]
MSLSDYLAHELTRLIRYQNNAEILETLRARGTLSVSNARETLEIFRAMRIERHEADRLLAREAASWCDVVPV